MKFCVSDSNRISFYSLIGFIYYIGRGVKKSVFQTYLMSHLDENLFYCLVVIDGEHRAFSHLKITVSDVCYHHQHET